MGRVHNYGRRHTAPWQARPHQQARQCAYFILLVVGVVWVPAAAHRHTGSSTSPLPRDVGARHGAMGCGSDAPHLVAMEAAAPRVPVAYGSTSAPSGPRGLQSSFITIDEADSSGQTSPIRIFVRFAV